MHPENIDIAWLNSSLQRSLETGSTIVEYSADSIGTGQVGENVRFSLRWSADDPGLPASVVGKFPSTSEVSRSTAVQLNTYVREVGFYRDLRDQVDIRTPRLHALEWDPTTHSFVLLMEDISPARVGDQLSGCSIADAELAVDQAVALHAPSWGRVPELGAGGWLGGPTGDEEVAVRRQMFDLLTPGFVERYAERLSERDLELAGPLTASFSRWQQLVRHWVAAHGAWCLVHGDYRLDNMLFGQPPASPSLTVVDWQTVSVGIGPADLAYFCGAGLTPDVRERHERALVDRYTAGLVANGVEVDAGAVWDGYVLGSATGYFMAVLASQIVERTERGDEMFAVMAERHASQVRTVGLMDVLEAS